MTHIEHLETGKWGESLAEKMLRRKKYRILGRRVHIGVRDEIDLVARDHEVLVFVEVKTRKQEDYGRPITAVDRKKRHALSRAAVRYLKRLKIQPDAFRFDVVEVIGLLGDGHPVLRHIENAFQLDKHYLPPV